QHGDGQVAAGVRHANRSIAGPGSALPGNAIILTAFGGSDRLSYETVAVSSPGPGEVRIRQSAIGVNYIDIYIRKGEFRMVTPPAALGMEAAGTVVDIGAGVHHLLPGDAVAYVHDVPGAYATLRTLPADRVVPVPAGIDAET